MGVIMKYIASIWIAVLLFMSCSPVEEATYLVAFDNKTEDDYIIYTRPEQVSAGEGPVFVAASVDWKPVLIVRAREKGEEEILLRDPEAFGLQIKLEPQRNSATVFYLRSGIKESGDCIQPWFVGPFALNVSLTEEDLNNPLKNYRAVKRIRYCGYRTTSGLIEIYPDAIKLVSLHNMKVLDTKKVMLNDLKNLKKEAKK